MRSRIALRCGTCGNAALREREDTDPPRAVEVETGHCDICDDGDFGSETYWDAAGQEVSGDPETFSA